MTNPATISARWRLILVLASVCLLAGLLGCSSTNPEPQGDGYVGPPIIPGQTNAIPPPTY